MNPAPNFDHLARIYRWLEAVTFGPALAHCRCAFLDTTHSSQNALVLGDGDGRFTARLFSANPAVRVDAVDGSPAMLATLVRNAGPDAARVRAHLADARSFTPPNPPYDLVVSHFFLDCLTTDEVALLARRLRPCVAPSAQWLVSDFAIPAGGFGPLIARPLVAALYFAFRLLTGLRVRRLPNHLAALSGAGFTIARRTHLLCGLLVSEIWTT